MKTYIDDLMEPVKDKKFLTSQELLAMGIFGSKSACLQALRLGVIPNIRVGEGRTLVPVAAVREFLENRCRHNAQEAK